MLGAGLLARKAVDFGLTVKPYIKTSLSPGSGVVTYYLQASNVIQPLRKLGFDVVGYGCMTCIGNSGPLHDIIIRTIEQNQLVCCSVLSGNRNFEGRIHPNTRANFLASPLLVIAYAIAGRIDIDFENEPLGENDDGKTIFLRDIWPSRKEIQSIENEFVIPAMFAEVYNKIKVGSHAWQSLDFPNGNLYPWDKKSTYIKEPPFFEGLTKEPKPVSPILGARVILLLGDSVTTGNYYMLYKYLSKIFGQTFSFFISVDHISPAGSIARNSPAAKYLASCGLTPREFNSYGSRRGNDAVMARGTFANIRLKNKLCCGRNGPITKHIPTNEELDIFDCATRYLSEGIPLIAIVGKEYGSGSSRDWAAKGPYMLGIRAIIAESYERIHRSNLIGK